MTARTAPANDRRRSDVVDDSDNFCGDDRNVVADGCVALADTVPQPPLVSPSNSSAEGSSSAAASSGSFFDRNGTSKSSSCIVAAVSAVRTVEHQLHALLDEDGDSTAACSRSDDGMRGEEAKLSEAEELLRRELEGVDDDGLTATAATLMDQTMATTAVPPPDSLPQCQMSAERAVLGRKVTEEEEEADDDDTFEESWSGRGSGRGSEREISVEEVFETICSRATYRTPKPSPPSKKLGRERCLHVGPSPMGVADIFDPIGITIETPSPPQDTRTRDDGKDTKLGGGLMDCKYKGNENVSSSKTVERLLLPEMQSLEVMPSVSLEDSTYACSPRSLVSDMTDHDVAKDGNGGGGFLSDESFAPDMAEKLFGTSSTKEIAVSRPAASSGGNEEGLVSKLAWLAFGPPQTKDAAPTKVMACTKRTEKDHTTVLQLKTRSIECGLLCVAAAAAIFSVSYVVLFRGPHLLLEGQYWAMMTLLLPPLAITLKGLRTPDRMEEASVSLCILLCGIALERTVCL